MRRRNPQLALRLDAKAPDATERWRDGVGVAYLGGVVTLHLGTDCKEATLDGDVLHLPLPPEATARQIQDAAEAWLRSQALRIVAAAAIMAARRLGREAPRITLSFAARGGWAQPDDAGGLRFHWRLVEQPEAVLAQVVARAVASLPPPATVMDMFAAA